MPVAGVVERDRLSADGVEVARRLVVELRLAAFAAEVVGAPLVGRRRLARVAVYRHPADGVLRAASQRQRDQEGSDPEKGDLQEGRAVARYAAARDRVDRGPFRR